MERAKFIERRQLTVGDRQIAVDLFRNEGGSVAARCVLGDADMPIIDGPTVEAALAVVAEALDGLLFARGRRGL